MSENPTFRQHDALAAEGQPDIIALPPAGYVDVDMTGDLMAPEDVGVARVSRDGKHQFNVSGLLTGPNGEEYILVRGQVLNHDAEATTANDTFCVAQVRRTPEGIRAVRDGDRTRYWVISSREPLVLRGDDGQTAFTLLAGPGGVRIENASSQELRTVCRVLGDHEDGQAVVANYTNLKARGRVAVPKMTIAEERAPESDVPTGELAAVAAVGGEAAAHSAEVTPAVSLKEALANPEAFREALKDSEAQGAVLALLWLRKQEAIKTAWETYGVSVLEAREKHPELDGTAQEVLGVTQMFNQEVDILKTYIDGYVNAWDDPRLQHEYAHNISLHAPEVAEWARRNFGNGEYEARIKTLTSVLDTLGISPRITGDTGVSDALAGPGQALGALLDQPEGSTYTASLEASVLEELRGLTADPAKYGDWASLRASLEQGVVYNDPKEAVLREMRQLSYHLRQEMTLMRGQLDALFGPGNGFLERVGKLVSEQVDLMSYDTAAAAMSGPNGIGTAVHDLATSQYRSIAGTVNTLLILLRGLAK